MTKKNQLLTIYRGTSVYNKDGYYFTTDKEWARQFTQSGQDKEIIQAQIDPSIIVKFNPLPQATNEEDINKSIKLLKEKGYSAFWVDEGINEPNSIFVINKNVLKNVKLLKESISEKPHNIIKKIGSIVLKKMLSDNNLLIHKNKIPQRPKNAYDINCGYCEEWANEVVKTYENITGKKDIEILDVGNITGNPDDSIEYGHVFIRFKGKYYDAECLNGVNNWNQLPLIKKHFFNENKDYNPSDAYYKKLSDDEKRELAMSYFSIGHDGEDGESPNSHWCWIWDGNNILAKRGGTHSCNFGGNSKDNTFAGWYDTDKNIISICFPDRELRKLSGRRPTKDDIPQNVYIKLIRKFGKNNPSFLLFESKTKKLIQEKTLFHGTLIDNLRSIEKYGILPSIGEFVKRSYESDIIGCDCDPKDYIKELVFATDKDQLDKAVTAITAQISYKLNKSFHDITDEEFIRYGAIAVIKDGDSVMNYRKDRENWGDEYPYTAEPGDYYSEDSVGVDFVLTGKKMINVLKKYGLWPRYSVFGDNISQKSKKDILIKMAIKRNPNKTKEEILNIINSWDAKMIDSYYKKHRYMRENIKNIISEIIQEELQLSSLPRLNEETKEEKNWGGWWLSPEGKLIEVYCKKFPGSHWDMAKKILEKILKKQLSVKDEVLDMLKRRGWVMVRFNLYDDKVLHYNKQLDLPLTEKVESSLKNLAIEIGASKIQDEVSRHEIPLNESKKLDERLTFGDMYDETDDERIFKSKLPGMRVKPLQVTTNNDKDMWRFDYSYISNEKSEWEQYHEKVGHKGHIYFFKEDITDDDNLEDLECQVDCDCRDFKYRFSYVLTQNDASINGPKSLNKATNAPPIKTNPTGEKKLCKHLSSLQKYLITNIEKAMRRSHLRKRPVNIFESMNELADKGKFTTVYYDEDKK